MKARFSRRNSAWFRAKRNDAGRIMCPVCGFGMEEIKARHGAYENFPELQCKYFLCEQSGFTFFGDDEELAFVSESQGLLNLAQEESDGGSF